MSSNQVEPQGQGQGQASQSQGQTQTHTQNQNQAQSQAHSQSQANPNSQPPDQPPSVHHQHSNHHSPHPQHPPHPPHPSQAVAQLPSNSNDSYICQWANCGKRVETPELLYDHVCETHIGRKSTNNLNLVCAWGNCQIQVIKRDHITSHIRVHVPLKPHRCEFCGKAFKRPQDLKKHVKTHAEDTVLVRASDQQNGNRANPNGHYSVGGQHKPNGYYNDQQQQHAQLQSHPPMGYGHPAPNGSQGYYGPTQQPHASYGHVFYPANQGGDGGNHTNLDVRNHGINTLNNFYYDTQRGHFDPKSYPQVESRLLAIQAGQLPFMSPGGLSEYANAGGAISGGGPQVGVYAPTAQYQLPGLDHLRTKNDLLLVDQIMEQAQATIYDRPNQMAAAGVNPGSQPGTYYVRSGMKYRQSHSPPRTHVPSHYSSGAATSPATVAASYVGGDSPPALTPTDSTHSYHSARSPVSLHSNLSMSPATTATMYPTLPTTSSDAMSTDFFPSRMAPTSTLGTQFHDDGYHRMSGGSLQRAGPSSRAPKQDMERVIKDRKMLDADEMDISSDDGTAKRLTSRSSSPSSKGEDQSTPQLRPRAPVSDSMIDPALSGGSGAVASPPSGELDERDIKENEVWVGIVRTIEGLRAWIRRRIENGDYEGEVEDGEEKEQEAKPKVKNETSDAMDRSHDKQGGQALYPVLGEVGVES